jgi:cell shape-determining protein MreD
LVALLFFAENALRTVWPGTPSLVLIGVLFYSLSAGPLFGFLIGAFGGLFFEIYGVGSFGFSMLVLGGVGAACGAVSGTLFRESFATQLLLPACAAYTITFFHLAAMRVGGGELNAGVFLDAFSFWNIFFTALASPLLFGLLLKTSPRRRTTASRR